MYNFSNDTATDPHHDHDQDTAGPDAGPKHEKTANAESTHSNKKRNHHKLEKESKDMTRMIKNSITPVVAAIAVSVTFLFGLVGDASAADKLAFKNDDRTTAIAKTNSDVKAEDYDWNTRSYSEKWVAITKDQIFVRADDCKLGDATDVKSNDTKIVGAADNKSVKSDKDEFAGSEVDLKAEFDGDKISNFDRDEAARDDTKGFATDDERNFAEIKNNKQVDLDGDNRARTDVDSSKAKEENKSVNDEQDQVADSDGKDVVSFGEKDSASFEVKDKANFVEDNDNGRPHRIGFVKESDSK